MQLCNNNYMGSNDGKQLSLREIDQLEQRVVVAIWVAVGLSAINVSILLFLSFFVMNSIAK